MDDEIRTSLACYQMDELREIGAEIARARAG